MMVRNLLGWKKDKYDPRDYLHRPKLVRLPRLIDNLDLMPSVRDQGMVGSCVGFGIGSNLCAVAKALGIFTEWFSPTWIYNGARYIEGTLPYDIGCEPGDALEWLFDHGSLLEHFWPYNPVVLDKSAPSSERQSQAVRYDNFAYYRVDNGQAGIISALADGRVVSIGAPWFDKWEFCPAGGVLPPVTKDDSVAGGHETCIYKADQDTGLFWAQNSWGTGWGVDGRYAFRFEALDVFKQLGGYDAHYTIFDATPLPPEPPGPEPSPCVIGNGIAGILNVVQRRLGRKGRFFYMNP